MRIINCQQGSEAWEYIRKGKATASRFGEIVTPSKLQFSKQSKGYAMELVAEMFGIETPPRLPSFDMENGTDREPLAREEFAEAIGLEVLQVGFVLPDHTERWGCSPDALVGGESVLEIKCPRAETLIQWHLSGEVPSEYLSQIQGQLWITGRTHCFFYGWHPELEPFQGSVYAIPEYADAFEEALPKFIQMVDEMAYKVRALKRSPLGIDFAGVSYE